MHAPLTSERRLTATDATLTVAVIAIAILLQLPFRLLWVSLTDEGLILQIADDLLRGRHLYVDAVHYAFPGVFYLTAAMFAIFGTSIETARSLTIGLFAITCGLAYLIARWWYTWRGALIVVVLFLSYRVWAYPHWQMLSYSTLAVMLALLATWILGEGLARARGWRFVLAGAVAGAVVLAKQDSGAMTVAALGAALLVCRPVSDGTRLQRAVLFGTGCGLVLGAAGVAIWYGGFGPDMIRETILAPLYGAGHFDHVRRPALWPLFAQDAGIRQNLLSYLPSILVDLHWSDIVDSGLYRSTPLIDLALKLVYHLPWLLLVAATLPMTLALRRRPADVDAQRTLLIACLAFGFLVAFNPPQDWVHLLVLYPPTLLLAAALAAQLPISRGLSAVLGIAVVLAGVGSTFLATGLLGIYRTPVQSPRGVLYARPGQAGPLSGVVRALTEGSRETPLAALPYHPMLNFLSARPGVTRFYLVWPVERDEHRDEAVAERLEANPAADVVYTPNHYPGFPRLAAYAPVLFAFLVDHYTVDRAFVGDGMGYTFFLLRRKEALTGRSLLDGALASAEVAVVPHGRPPRVVTDAERETLVGEALWPFERVLRVSPLSGERVTVRYRLAPAPGDRFEASYGINPELLVGLALPDLRFTVSVRDSNGEREVLAADGASLDWASNGLWRSASVDLSPWAGQSIEIVLGLAASSEGPRDAAGWGSPRIVGVAR